MAGRIVYTFPKGEVERAMDGKAKVVASAATKAMREVVDLAVTGARSNISSAGFRGDWVTGMRGFVVPKSGVSLSPVGIIFHKKGFASIFEHGGTIQGKPLLWLPIEKNLGALKGSARLTPKKFIAQGGRLRSVRDAKGRPLLVARNAAGKSVPVFFGIPAVSLRRRFNIVAIIKRAAAQIGDFYFQNIKQ